MRYIEGTPEEISDFLDYQEIPEFEDGYEGIDCECPECLREDAAFDSAEALLDAVAAYARANRERETFPMYGYGG